MTRLLVVEDDRNIGDGLAQYLSEQGFAVALARSLAEARAQLAPPPALVVLDWMLPDGQGIDLLTALRAAGDRTPVIFLTARGDLVDRVVGLEAGAADYVVKPFEPRELVARIRAQLRATAPAASTFLEASGVRLDPAACTVHAGDAPVDLTAKEFLLLKLLLENPNRVLSREEILNRVWGYDRAPTTRTVDTHVLQLRQKLPSLSVETVRGLGYRLKVVVVLLALCASLAQAAPLPTWLADSPAPADARAAHAAFTAGDLPAALAAARAALAAHPEDAALRDNLLALTDRVLELSPATPVGWSFPAGVRSLTVGVERERSPGRPDVRRVKTILGLPDAGGPGAVAVTLTRSPSGAVLDPSRGRGVSGVHRAPAFHPFHWTTCRLEPEETVSGLHVFSAALRGGAFTAAIPLSRLESTATPVVRSPRPDETFASPNPTIHFDDFRSPEYRPGESRELIAGVERDDELSFVDPDQGEEIWSLLIESPSVTSLTIGPQKGVEPGSVTALPPGRYVLLLTYREQRPYGPATLSRDSTTRIPFRISAK